MLGGGEIFDWWTARHCRSKQDKNTNHKDKNTNHKASVHSKLVDPTFAISSESSSIKVEFGYKARGRDVACSDEVMNG